MAISIETLALARKYADAVAAAGSKEALDKAVQQAVAESKLYTDDKFSHIVSFKVEIVDSLPETDINPHVIYFLKREDPLGENDIYCEYMYINNFWELIGSTQLDLSPYWTIEQTKAYIDSANTLGIKKVLWDAATEQILFFRDSTKSAVEDATFKVSISSSAVQTLNTRVGIDNILNTYQEKANLIEILNILTANDETAGSVAKLLKDAIKALDSTKEQIANPTDTDGTGLALKVVEEDGKITEISGSIDIVTEAQINSLFGK